MHSGWLLAEAILNKSTENHLQVNWKPVQNASALGLTVPGADLPDPPPEERREEREKTSRAIIGKEESGDGASLLLPLLDDDAFASLRAGRALLVMFFRMKRIFVFNLFFKKYVQKTSS